MRLVIVFLIAALGAAQRQTADPNCFIPNKDAAAANTSGLAAHRLRRLTEASAGYSKALSLLPPRELNAPEQALLVRFAPRIFVPASEHFPLKDAAAILHPSLTWIAYHLFWEDDIDFPDDNDPCDHELLWIRIDESRTRVAGIYTYFHGRILQAPEKDVDEANRNGGRARIDVQWGKHGSMPASWRELRIIADAGDTERAGTGEMALEEYNRRTWRKLSTQGREAQDSPLARGWPLKFTGSWTAFTTFSRQIDIRPMLQKSGYWKMSYFNNAVINRHFLVYNFSAKTEWPDQICK